jgi:hypothetical protein
MMSSWKGSIVFDSTVHTIISLKKENSCTDKSKIPALGKFQVHIAVPDMVNVMFSTCDNFEL